MEQGSRRMLRRQKGAAGPILLLPMRMHRLLKRVCQVRRSEAEAERQHVLQVLYSTVCMRRRLPEAEAALAG